MKSKDLIYDYLMKLFTYEELRNARSREKVLKYKCNECDVIFYTSKKLYQDAKRKNKEIQFCSIDCFHKSETFRVIQNCGTCQKEIEVQRGIVAKSKSGKVFCSQTCSGTYNNLHKTHGTRRSKLEAWLESQLTELYPNLEIKYNSKSEINSEIDIYFPKLKLAIELNGIFHYEPIYSIEKLAQIQNNDSRKLQACIENNIEFCIIDTSGQKYFKEVTSSKYLNIIVNILAAKGITAQNRVEVY